MAGIQLLALVWGILRFFREPCAKPRIIPWCSFGTFWLSSPNPLSSCSRPSHLPAVLRTVPPRLPSPAPIQVTENNHPCTSKRQEDWCCCLAPLKPAPCLGLLQWWSGTLLCASVIQEFPQLSRVGWVHFRYHLACWEQLHLWVVLRSISPPPPSQGRVETSQCSWL